MPIGRRVPGWFVPVAILLVLWAAMGIWSFYEHVAHGPAAMGAAPSDYDRRLFAALPGWYRWVFGVATWGGLAAAIALVVKRAVAVPLAAISLAAVVVMFGWMFLATDIIAVKGVWTTYFPALIVLVAAIQLWLARRAAARGWIA